MKIDADKVYKLKGVIQNYAWGGAEFIPQLLGLSNEEHKPVAEYWMGTHSSAPSELIENGNTIADLKQVLIEQKDLLGKKVIDRFNDLPYLLKILDVNDMLSIQVHPTKAEAEKGYEEEEARGIAINASTRNYKDKNHKPEVMIALSDFWLLHGFKPEAELHKTLENIPEFALLLSLFNRNNYRSLYSHVMEMQQEQVDAILIPLIKRELEKRKYGKLQRNDAGWWVTEYYKEKELKDIDRGIFSIYFFNIVYLEKGQGIFQAAGIPHAYLQGQNVELMANSDNVLRAGLTPKHIDVNELMKHTRFEPVHPIIMNGEQQGVYTNFYCPVDDFIITHLQLKSKESFSSQTQSAEIFICLEGSGSIKCSNNIDIKRGEAFIIFASNHYSIKADNNMIIYKAGVPV